MDRTTSSHGARRRSLVALSSAASELYAIVKDSSEILGLMAIMKDMNISPSLWEGAGGRVSRGYRIRKGISVLTCSSPLHTICGGP